MAFASSLYGSSSGWIRQERIDSSDESSGETRISLTWVLRVAEDSIRGRKKIKIFKTGGESFRL